jgi:hypothetical protein
MNNNNRVTVSRNYSNFPSWSFMLLWINVLMYHSNVILLLQGVWATFEFAGLRILTSYWLAQGLADFSSWSTKIEVVCTWRDSDNIRNTACVADQNTQFIMLPVPQREWCRQHSEYAWRKQNTVCTREKTMTNKFDCLTECSSTCWGKI